MKFKDIDWNECSKIANQTDEDDEYKGMAWGSPEEIDYIIEALYSAKEEIERLNKKEKPKDFIKQLPNIVIKEQAHVSISELRYTHWTMERLLEDVQKHCLDKAKVTKVLLENCNPAQYEKIKNGLGL